MNSVCHIFCLFQFFLGVYCLVMRCANKLPMAPWPRWPGLHAPNGSQTAHHQNKQWCKQLWRRLDLNHGHVTWGSGSLFYTPKTDFHTCHLWVLVFFRAHSAAVSPNSPHVTWEFSCFRRLGGCFSAPSATPYVITTWTHWITKRRCASKP